jgi:putative flavoprotein involved in K+ transport
MRQVDVVVIGAGQAGLATSYYLSANNIDHAVLDREGVGASWRNRRWDSFALNAPNWAFRLPGYTYDGHDPDAFMPRDQLVAEFTKYAQRINAPVEAPAEVLKVERRPGGGYELTTSNGGIQARAVVVATGAYQRRNRPNNKLAPGIVQLNTDQYRNPESLPRGGVLVVGSGQSGVQVAEDLIESGRPTWLATGSCGWIPRRMRGHDNVYWREQMGMFDETVEQLGHELRLACPPIQTGVAGGRDANLAIAQKEGITLLGRFLGANGHTVHLKDDLQQNATGSDTPALALRSRLDKFIADNGLDAPDEPPIEPAGLFPDAPTTLDLKANDINAVVWATGFRLDFDSWIGLPLNARDGYPEQTRGVSPQTGLYFMGLQLMHTRKSGLIFGVGEDAEYITGHIARQLDGAAPL